MSLPLRAGLWLAFLLALALGASAPAAAQTFVCPSGPGPDEVQVGTSGGGNGVPAVPICAPAAGGGGGGAGASQTTHGSFVIRPDVDDVWMAGNWLWPFAAELYAKKRKGHFVMQATYDSRTPGLVVHDFTIEVVKP